MDEKRLTGESGEKAVLVGATLPGTTEEVTEEHLDELAFLTRTAGATVAGRFTQRLERPNPKTFVGKGKADEIATFIKENRVDIAIFDEELSPSQLKAVEKVFGCRVVDRTNLILDIFASRARTAHAKTQVELAQYQYILPRLTRMWTHLERQRGGIGLRGPGETEIETDRRVIRDKIARLKEQLRKIDKQMATQRKNRGKMVRVALVGYTNVGKSTIMNMLGKTDLFAEDKLFATLDTTVRKVVIENIAFLLSDTVGFIRKLPHSLVESFKSTLDEVREADILLHVVDISHPGFGEQIEVVNETLGELDSLSKKIIVVFNKIDLYRYTEKEEDDLSPATSRNYSFDELRRSWMGANPGVRSVFISAKERSNVDELRNLLYEEVKTIHVKRYPYNDFLYDL